MCWGSSRSRDGRAAMSSSAAARACCCCSIPTPPMPPAPDAAAGAAARRGRRRASVLCAPAATRSTPGEAASGGARRRHRGRLRVAGRRPLDLFPRPVRQLARIRRAAHLGRLTHALRARTIVVASHNAGKLREIRRSVAPFGLEARVGQGARPARAGGDRHHLRGQRAASRPMPQRMATGLPALSDDSGLVRRCARRRARRLYGRWAEQPDGSRDFRLAMQQVEDLLRQAGARRACANAAAASSPCSALPGPDGECRVFRGEVEGTLVWPPRGEQGFGYDPMFVPDGYRPNLRRDERPREARLEARPGDRAVAPRPRLPDIRPSRARRGVTRHEPTARPASASTSIGRSARPSAPIATSTAMSATGRSTRRASRAAFARELATMRAPHRAARGHQHLPRRRHAVADAAGDGRRRSSTRSAATWTVPAGIEITLEANPSSVEAERFRGYRAAGRQPRLARRAGARTTRDLRFLGRLHIGRRGARRDRPRPRHLPAAVLRPDLCAAAARRRKPGSASSSRRSAMPPTTCRSTS